MYVRFFFVYLFILRLRCGAVPLLCRPALAFARPAIRLVIEFAGRVAFLKKIATWVGLLFLVLYYRYRYSPFCPVSLFGLIHLSTLYGLCIRLFLPVRHTHFKNYYIYRTQTG